MLSFDYLLISTAFMYAQTVLVIIYVLVFTLELVCRPACNTKNNPKKQAFKS